MSSANKGIVKMNNIIKVIENSKKAVVLGHIDEDSDSIGSTLAMCEMLKNMGKEAVLFLSGEPEHRLKFLISDYNYYDENVNIDDFDLLICIDTADAKRLGKRAVLLDKIKPSINIDHHFTNTNYADFNIVDGNMSSASEMVYDLVCQMGAEITKPMAEYLYCGIMGDTGCLKYNSATPKTAYIISELMKRGIDHAELARRIFDTDTFDVIKLKGYIMNNLESYYDGELTVCALDERVFERYNVRERDCGDIVNIPRSVEGTQIAVSIRDVGDKIKISFRSNGKYNVSDIAKNFGGGGHIMSAGATICGVDINKAKDMIVDVVGKYLKELTS